MAVGTVIGRTMLESRHTDVLTYLLEQPKELIAEVVQWLGLKDLLNLRITSRRLHELVHSHEEGICARYCRRLRLEHPAFQLPPKVHGLVNDLLFYTELQHQYELIRQLSLTLSEHVAMRINVRSPLHEKEDEPTWRARKGRKLHCKIFPWLFALNSFFECLKGVFITGQEAFSGIDDESLLSMHDVYDLDQQRLIEEMQPCEEDTINYITIAFAILLGVIAAKKLSLQSRSPKYPFASIKKIMIYRGLTSFDAILSRTVVDDAHRQKALIAVSERFMNKDGRKPLVYRKPPMQSISHLDTDRVQGYCIQTVGRLDVRNRFVDAQDVWYKAAFAVVQRKGSIHDFPPDTEQWTRECVYEDGDPAFDLRDWDKPGPP